MRRPLSTSILCFSPVFLLFACLSARAQSACEGVEAKRAFDDLNQAELFSKEHGTIANEKKHISDARQDLLEFNCSKGALAMAEGAVASVYLDSNDPATGAEHIAAACKFIEQISPELASSLKEKRWPLEFTYKGQLLVVLIELDRFTEAKQLTRELAGLATEHGLETSALVSTLIQHETDAFVQAKEVRAEAYRQAIESLAQGEVKKKVDMVELAEAAETHLFLGEYDEALARAKEAHRLLETQEPNVKREPDALIVLRVRGMIHLYLNEPEGAMKVFEEGGELVPGILDAAKADHQALNVANFHVARFYEKMALAQLLLNQLGNAQSTVDLAFKAAQASGFAGLTYVLGLDRLRAQIELNLHGSDQASLAKAQEIMTENDDVAGGWLLRLTQRFGTTHTWAELVRQLPQILTLASREDRIQVCSSLARAHEAKGDHDEAIQNYIAAIALIEEGRVQAKETEALPAFFSDYVDIYNGAIEALYARAERSGQSIDPALLQFGSTYPEVALYFSEAAHARQFAERYGPAMRDSFAIRNNLPQSVRDHERELRLQLGHTIDPGFVSLETLPDPRVMRQRSEEATKAYVEFLDYLKTQYPEFATFAFPRPVGLGELPRSLNGKFIVLYKVTESGVYWWLVFNQRICGFGRSEITKEELRRDVREFQSRIDEPGHVAGQLFNSLVRDAFSRIERLYTGRDGNPPRAIVIADDALYLFPWEALPGLHGGYLGDSFAISYAPSLTVLTQAASAPRITRQGRKALLVGDVQDKTVLIPIQNKDMSFSKLGHEELDRVIPVLRSSGYEPTVLTDADATQEALFHRDETQYSLIHFDTHAFAETLDPLPSLILHDSPESPLGLLTIADIAKLKLKARLVTLSACQTALGAESNPVPGEGVQSLARAFMVAGSRSVLATLWWITDTDAAGELMKDFYHDISAGSPGDEAVALFRSKATLRRGRFKAPHYWAPFILIGDPGN
jgi:CHAT domain-containing protein